MKQMSLLLLTFIICQSFTANTSKIAKDVVFSTSQTETKTIALDHFDAVQSETSINLEIVKSDVEKAVITSNYLQDVVVNVKNNVLTIGYIKGKSIKNAETKVVIYAKDIKSVYAESGAIFKIKEGFAIQQFSVESGAKIYGDTNAKSVSISAESGGFISGNINSENLVLATESGSSVELQGKVNSASISSESGSKVNAINTSVSNATVAVESGADVTLSVTKSLTASAETKGKIRYKTESNINLVINKSTGGKIENY